MCHGNGQPVCLHDPFHLSTPFSRILAVRLDKFLHTEVLVGTVPIYIGLRMKVGSGLLLVLGENGFPKLLYVHQLVSP